MEWGCYIKKARLPIDIAPIKEQEGAFPASRIEKLGNFTFTPWKVRKFEFLFQLLNTIVYHVRFLQSD